MMERRLFTLSQLRLAARIVQEQGVAIRLDPNGSITIFPSQNSEHSDTLPDYSVGLVARRLDEMMNHETARPSRAADERTFEEALAAMNPNSRKVLSGGRLWDYEDFQAHIVKRPLNKRESAALQALSEFEVGEAVPCDRVKIGMETQERLVARGYVETRPSETFPDQEGYYVLTEAGSEASRME